MCASFMNLNVAYPKDLYLLPEIDLLIDGSSGHRMLSVMVSYSGYNHIRTDPLHVLKTSFMSNHGTYYYNVMPFGLKNADATYQRLMDANFPLHRTESGGICR